MAINDKQQAFINEYMINGHNASKAYAKAYPDCKVGIRQAAARLLTNVDIKAEIDSRMAGNRAKAEYEIEHYQQELEQARQRAITGKANAAEVSAIVAKGRSMGYDKQIIDDRRQEVELTETERAEASAIANIRLKTG